MIYHRLRFQIFRRAVLSILFLGLMSAANAQENQKQKTPDDVVRVYTDLVQTDVTVFDKQGHFINGLTPADFNLRVDGKPRAIEFFEQISAGSASEEAQLAAARGLPSARRSSSHQR